MIAKIKCWWRGRHDVACFPCSEPALTYCLDCGKLWSEDGSEFSDGVG